jgi:hypothetical protein
MQTIQVDCRDSRCILARLLGGAASAVASPDTEARWQSGYAADCNSVYAGSIPTLASISSFRDGQIIFFIETKSALHWLAESTSSRQ